MLIAAATAIAEKAEDMELVPNALAKDLHIHVANKVAKAAFDSGVARAKPEVYYHKAEYQQTLGSEHD